MASQNGRRRRKIFLRAFLAALLIGVIALTALVAVISISPATGTVGADLLRSLLGPQIVADLESVVFTIQDNVHHALFVITGSTPAAPWQVYTSTPSANALALSPAATPETTPPAPDGITRSILDKNALNASDNATPTPTSAPAPTPWVPPSATPLGNIPQEGQWQVYIQDASGNPLAYRTFLQPDPTRPYVTVGVVAIDLTRVDLRYQLGTEEPAATGRAAGTGRIPPEYLQPGVLLAAFNGGFKTIHGHFGVIEGDTTLIPMINGIGTLVIYKDGRVRIGEWGYDLQYTPDMLIARQNCPLLVQKGQINPLVYDNSVRIWGGTIEGNTVTLRSGVGLSQDGKILYYFAGNYLTMPAMASSMVAVGAYQAMQLDINNYYVLFTNFEVHNGQLAALSLLPKVMVDNVGRFLDSYARDFFYVTLK